MGLMAAYQFAKRFGILPYHHLGNQFIVANAWCPQFFVDSNYRLRAP